MRKLPNLAFHTISDLAEQHPPIRLRSGLPRVAATSKAAIGFPQYHVRRAAKQHGIEVQGYREARRRSLFARTAAWWDSLRILMIPSVFHSGANREQAPASLFAQRRTSDADIVRPKEGNQP